MTGPSALVARPGATRLLAVAVAALLTAGSFSAAALRATADGPSVMTAATDLTDGPVAPEPTTGSAGEAVLAGLTDDDLPDGCVEPNRHLTLYAEELPRVEGAIRIGYGMARGAASYPGPTIEMIEGECLAITVVNDVSEATLAELRDDPLLGTRDPAMPLGVSLHVHGVKYTEASDGTMHTGSWVPPGGARTYVWYAEPRTVAPDGRLISHGTAGYWWYHDHVVGTDHGTGGIDAGLWGALVVRRPGDPLPDRTYAVAMGDRASLNNRNYPDTDTCDPQLPEPSITCFVAARGERVEFVVFGIGNEFHTFHLHGHTWADNRHGLLRPTDDQTKIVDVVTLGPSDSFGFQIVAGASVGEGSWMLHCHVQRHSDLGMATYLHVVEPDEIVAPPGSVDTLDPAVDVPALVDGQHAGARFRGASTAPDPADQSDQALGFYCSLPLSPWFEARTDDDALPG